MSKRIDHFVDWFGTSVDTDDCDPALYMMNYIFERFEFNLEQKYWMCWLYANTYNFATAYVIWNEFPDFHLVDMDRLKDWNDKNYKRLRYQIDTKWNKGHLPEMFESYRAWIGSGSQHDKFQSLRRGNKFLNFHMVWAEALKLHKFGRYTTWFYLQALKHCVGINIDSPTLFLDNYDGSRSHRNGLCYVLDRDDLIDTRLNPEDLHHFDEISIIILDETIKQYPHLAKKLDYFAMETALCSFKKLFRIKKGRYMGYYHDRQAEEIKQIEKDGWTGINWTPLWQCRQENIDPKYLNGKIDTEKMKLYLQQNSTKPTLHIIGGMPVTGKTTLMRQIRTHLRELHWKSPAYKTHELLRYEEYENHIVLGIYDGDTFDGTDKLSMAVNKDALDFLKTNQKKVLVEGDRLFNLKFIDGAMSLGYDVKITILIMYDLQELVKRYKQRGQIQSSTFLKGRHTKIANISAAHPTNKIDSFYPLEEENILQFI